MLVLLLIGFTGLMISCSGGDDTTVHPSGEIVPGAPQEALNNYRLEFNGRQLTFQDQMLYLILAVNLYRAHVGAYPSQVNNLEALQAQPDVLEATGTWRGPYVDSELFITDPWGNRLRYTIDDEGIMDLRSLGADGVLSNDDLVARELFPDVWREMDKLPQVGVIPIPEEAESAPAAGTELQSATP
jgi:hypothetical protein